MRGKSWTVLVVVALMAIGPSAGAVGGTKTGYQWRSSCTAQAPQPWVVGTTRGTTEVKGPGRTDTLKFYNARLSSRSIIGSWNGGAYRVYGATEIDVTQTYGFCSD